MKKGIKSTNDKSNLALPEYAKKSINFVPIENGFRVRNGSSRSTWFDSNTYGFVPAAANIVTISGLEVLLMICEEGSVYAVVPERMDTVYKVHTRRYDVTAAIELAKSTSETPPSAFEIIQVNTFIYLLSDQLCWVIAGDGVEICDEKIDTSNYRLIVDAYEATIRDADNETPVFFATNGWSSRIPEGERLFYRVRNEFGGVGAPSKTVTVPKSDSYLLAGAKGMVPDVWGISANKKIVKDIFGFGVKTSNGGAGTETYQCSFNPTDMVGDTLGIVANDSTDIWNNVTVTVGQYYQPDDVNYITVAHDGTTDDTTQHNTYTVNLKIVLFITQDGQTFLTTSNAETITFAEGQLIYVDYLITGYDGTNYEKLKGPFLIKFTSGITSFSGAAKFIDVFATTVAGPLQIEAASVTTGNEANYYTVEVEGIDNILQYINGSRFFGTGGSTEEYVSITGFVPVISYTSTGDPTEPVVFCDKFPETPGSGGILTMSYCHYAINDDNCWNYLNSNLANPVYRILVKADIDSDGLFLLDFYQSRSNLLVIIYQQNVQVSDADTRYLFDVLLTEINNDVWLGGTKHNLMKDEYGTSSLVPGELYNWNPWGGDGVVTNPVLLCKIGIVSHPYNKFESRNVGAWNKAAYFSERMFFAFGNQIKVTNMLLEWSPTSTVQLNGIVRFMIPLDRRLMVFTDSAMYAVDSELNVEPMADIVAQNACAVANQVFFIDSEGVLYNTNFAQIPAGSVTQQTKNPYITIVSNSDIIKEKTDDWHVYDMVYYDKSVYISSNLGVFMFNLDSGLWWQLDYSATIAALSKFVKYRDKLLCIGGNFNNTVYFNNYSWPGIGGA